jgi:rhamnose utilization protein RhaD (predicted bifunctional aldolase and dehydrogenase)/NAD(P)-dependent dehydrogenase (short-subunit alcohol dehydrogenase family)
MRSGWDDVQARVATEHYAGQGVGEDLALRTYSARLLGADPTLVLHGGGNTSVKTRALDLYGEEIDVLCVKGSGWDLATIEPPGHPAVRLRPLLRMRSLERLSDEDMVNAQRQNLLDTGAPNPSVETLLHAFIPSKFIDHTHAMAVLALANQPDAQVLVARVYGDRVACVPYVMPGFDLAKAAAEAFESRGGLEGLILINHGVFSFGATARESYERMIDLVSVAEDYIEEHGRPGVLATPTTTSAGSGCFPVLRGLLARKATKGGQERWVFDRRETSETRALVDDPRLEGWAARGVATPDHVIRTKRHPLVLPAPADDLAAWIVEAADALDAYVAGYEAYFACHAPNAIAPKTQLDPLPRVVAIPGVGLIGLGRNSGEAKVVADVAETWAATLLRAEAIGHFAPLGAADTFDMEYWSLEQAKLGKSKERRLERRVALVTGGGGAIGAAIAKAFAGEGAEVVVLDIDADRVRVASRAIGPNALPIACDVTDPDQVGAAFDQACGRFGGIDIVVSNAGSATTGKIADLDPQLLRDSFDLNFFAHQAVAQAAIRVFRAQGIGGVLLFNASKQAVNPGSDFGAYGAPKAALLALVRQYALEHGADGVRVNAINPDRIRSGLLTDAMIASRAKSRGVSEGDYMAGNLLGQEVTANDVGQAFVLASLLEKTTGAIIPVDGGNVAAMLR